MMESITACRATGCAVFEVPFVRKMIEGTELDTVADVDRHAIHGGSLRVFCQPTQTGAAPSQAVRTLFAAEADNGLTDPAYDRAFARDPMKVGFDPRCESDQTHSDALTLRVWRRRHP